ncbi:MAG: 50S ribosomal protein L9 [Simkaniaceae bacterium]|nr:50S ribosomal protein L9 [Simkaniaceae bacterium]
MRETKQLLLIEDVDGLGRKGDLVAGAKPGFVRNYLFPMQKAVIADKRTIRMRERLMLERAQQAVADKNDSEALALKINGQTFSLEAKVDTSGHMYGSVSTKDIVALLDTHAISVDRKQILISSPIKKLGVHSIPLRLKEGVQASFTLNVRAEGSEEAS